MPSLSDGRFSRENASLAVALASLLVPLVAAADPTVLRIATEAPDGTAWAREMKAVSRDVESATRGELRIKWYFGGIAGDELQMAERMRRGQLDGAASGGMLCQRLAPTLRIFYFPSLFFGREESAFVLGRLTPTLDREFAQAGFADLGMFGMGPVVIFSRTPIQTMADLRKTRLWIWNLSEIDRVTFPALGLLAVPLPIGEAARAYDQGRIDGFVSVPAGALANQWSAQARYVIDLRLAYLVGCVVVKQQSLDALPIADQKALRAAIAKGTERIDEVARQQDGALLGGLFARQGLRSTPVSPMLQSEFFAAARAARPVVERLFAKETVARVIAWLADYRAEHGGIHQSR